MGRNIPNHGFYCITTAVENSKDQLFSCYVAMLCFCGGEKIQVRYVCSGMKGRVER